MSSQGNPKYVFSFYELVLLFSRQLYCGQLMTMTVLVVLHQIHILQRYSFHDRMTVTGSTLPPMSYSLSVVMMLLPILWAEHESCSKESLQDGWYQHGHQKGSRRRLVLTLPFFPVLSPDPLWGLRSRPFQSPCIHSDPVSKESLGMTRLWKGHVLSAELHVINI